VLAYLLKTDLLLYVISSRIGLRQADFLFLAELKKMGLLPHIRFLINLDLTEHQSLGDIQGITQRLQQELAPLLPQPSLYAFSALQLLLERRRQRGEILPEREEALLAVWATDPQIQSFSAGEAQRFTVELGHLLQELRHRRLMGSSLSQVATVAQGFKEQLALVQELLGKDLASFQDLEGRFQQRRQPLRATLESLRLTLRGVESNLQKKIKKRIDSYFDRHSRQGASLYTFIQQYEPNWQEVAPQEAAEPLRLALFRLFQEFQKELGRFAASVFNLQAMEFIRNQELWLRERLAETGAPLFLSLEEALSLYYRDLGTVGLSVSPPTLRVDLPPPPPELTAPLLQVQFDPGWRWASETWVRAGAGWLRRSWLKVKARLGFQAETDPRRQLLQELAYALKAMKRWLQEESHSLLLDYRERLKFRYFFPLLAYWLKRQESDLENLMGSLLADFEGLADIMRQEERQREVKRREVQELMAAVVEVSSLLEREA
jgi:hypothetical protein